MRNDDEADEHDELAPVRRCGYCRTPMLAQREGAKFCGRRCKELSAAKRRRGRARVETLRARYPAADLSLAELYERATAPRPVANKDQDDEAGHHGDDGGHLDDDDDGPGAWSDAWRLHESIERVQRRYERRLQPYRAQLARNPGVRPHGLVHLEQQRDDEIDAMIREYNRRAELDRAHRNAPRRLNEAHERQAERAALHALAQDLPGSSRRYAPPAWTGRATSDLFRW